MVSKAREDFPLPDTPVITVVLFRGMVTSTCFRLLVVIPLKVMFEILFLVFTGDKSVTLSCKAFKDLPV